MKVSDLSLEKLQQQLEKEKAARIHAEARLANREQVWKTTMRKQARAHVQAAARAAEKQKEESIFREVVNHLPGIVFQLQRKGENRFVFNFVSPLLHQMLGTHISDASQLLPFIHPDDRNNWINSLRETFISQKHWKYEIRFLMPDGGLHWWLSSASPSFNHEGELLYSGMLINNTRQKQIEHRLLENELKWRFAMESSGDGFWEFNVALGKAQYSSIFKDLTGLTEEDREVPDAWRKLIHPDDLPVIDEMLQGYSSGTQSSHSIQYRIRNRTGAYSWIMDRGIVFLKDQEGQPQHLIGIHTNISQIKETETELAATATKLTTLITNMQEGILLEDENNRVMLCNQAFCDIFDISIPARELIGRDTELVLERKRSHFADFETFVGRRSTLRNGCQKHTNEEIQLSNGKFLVRDYAPLVIDGVCKGHLWKYTDVTQKHNAEEALMVAEKRYRSLIENMQVGLIEFDMAENILYANQTFYEMCGYTEAELNGQVSPLLLSGNGQLSDEKMELRKKGISDAYEAQVRHKRGEERWWYISGVPRQDDQHKTVSAIAACIDITMRKQYEQELQKAKQLAEDSARAKDVFLANMSHEIRTPMNAVFGMARLMGKTSLSEQQRFYLDTISTASTTLEIIVNDILDFSKIKANKLTLKRTGFRLNDVISDAVGMISFSAKDKGLNLITNCFNCCRSILMGDPFRLKQVFINLLTNAVKFTEKGSVTISCVNKGLEDGRRRHLVLQVADTGRGMDKDFLKILFDKFTQEDESIARSYSGTGLGMSISRQLIELMGGNISVESDKNIGTTFTLDLFFEEGTPADLMVAEHAVAVDIALLVDKQVLLVEDNETNQLLAKTILEQNGMKVTVASNGVEAVEQVASHPFDLVLMDMQMPVMDGLQATAIIRQTDTELPIVALTANALSGERDKCIAAGMNDFLTKPFEEAKLLGTLCKWIKNKEGQQWQPAETTFETTNNMATPGYTVDYSWNVADQVSTPEPIASPVQPLYDLSQIWAIGSGNREFVETLVRMFISDALQTTEKVKAASAAGDFKTVKAQIHRIKPSIEQLAIPYMQEIRRIEALCLAEEGGPELDQLIEDFEKMLSAVTALMMDEINL